MKRPLLPVACCLIAGILCGELARPSLVWMFAASFLVVALALAGSRARSWLLPVALFLTGWTNACWRSAILSPNDLRVAFDEHPRFVTLRGVVRAPPSQRIFEREQREFWHSSALIDALEFSTNGEWHPAVGRVVAGASGILPTNIFEGQTVEVTGLLQPPRGPVADGLFDPRAFYKREGVFFVLQTSEPRDWQAANLPLPVSERFRQWARKTLALGLPEEDEPLRLTWTLMLDWKAPLTDAVEEPFLQAGTYHIFAVDGLRIGIIAAIELGLLRLLRIPRHWCGLIVLPALWAYAGLMGWPASAIRAAIMATVLIFGWVCRRPVDLINSLFAAAVIVLLWNPAQLFQPGFQLSFVVVLCIGLVLPRVRAILRGWFFARDPFLPDSLQKRWPDWLYAAISYFIDTVAMSMAAWAGSIPLSAYYFHLFTPASIPANCVVVPATALAVMGGALSLMTGGWFPGLAELFNNSTWLLMKFINWFSGCASRWPGGHANVATPSAWTCVYLYLVLLVVASGWIFRSRFKWAVAGALGTAAIAIATHWILSWRIARLDILPAGGAPVIVVSPPGLERKLLVNCGNDESAANLVKPFLCAHGVNRMTGVCLAVGRLEYFGGAKRILTDFAADGVFASAIPNRSAAYQSLVADLRRGRGWQAVSDGDLVSGWTVLHPGANEKFAQADDNALALRRELNGQSILLLPSLGRDGQDALMRRHPDLRADIVIAGLPARDEPLCEPLLDQLRPKMIIIADAAFPATKRASAKLRERLQGRATAVIFERDTGALTLQLTQNGSSLQTADGWPLQQDEAHSSAERMSVENGQHPLHH